MKIWNTGDRVLHDDLNANFSAVAGLAPMALGDLRRYGWADVTTDQTFVFTAALAAIPSAGGEIVIPYGNNPTTLGGVVINKPVRIRGEGGPNGQATIKALTPMSRVFNVTSPFVAIDNLAFVQAGTKQTAGEYIYVSPGAHRFKASRLTMTEFFEGLTVGGVVASVNLFDLLGLLYVAGSSQTNAFLRFKGGMDMRVGNCTANGPTNDTVNCRAGILVEACGDLTLSNCDIIAMGSNLLVAPGNGQEVDSLCVYDSFLDSAYRGFDFSPIGTGQISRCILDGVGCSSHAQQGGLLNGAAATINGVQIIGCDFFANQADGLYVAGASFWQVSHGRFCGNGSNGVNVAVGLNDFQIMDSLFGAACGFADNGGVAVFVGAGANDRYSIERNLIKSAKSICVSDGGTGTHKSVWNNPGDPTGGRIYRDPSTGRHRMVFTQTTYSGLEIATDDGSTKFTVGNVGGIGVFGHAAPTSQPAAPVTLADVIAIIRGCGLSA